MNQQEEITLQTLTYNEDVQIGYFDEDIVVVDSIQQFTEVKTAHIAMNTIVICTSGKVQAQMNGRNMELFKNQMAVIPQNVMVTDVMVSPDFNLKAIFLTNRRLQSFLREKMNIWNEMMYIHQLNIIQTDDKGMVFFSHFYDMLCLLVEKGQENPYYTETIQSLLRSAILVLMGNMKRLLSTANEQLSAIHSANGSLKYRNKVLPTAKGHFQQFLDLLHSTDVKYRTVEAYANDLCISPKYLTAICKKQSGKTANEWIREQVLEDIRYYLRQTNLSIKQICDRLRFPNPSFFGKYVKDHFGMTPLEFRNS
jgi:AraC-like DNA-binding protein